MANEPKREMTVRRPARRGARRSSESMAPSTTPGSAGKAAARDRAPRKPAGRWLDRRGRTGSVGFAGLNPAADDQGVGVGFRQYVWVVVSFSLVLRFVLGPVAVVLADGPTLTPNDRFGIDFVSAPGDQLLGSRRTLPGGRSGRRRLESLAALLE